jgi:oligoendopeptidase F
LPQTLPTTWDLSDLFAGLDDPRIEETLTEQEARAKAFAERYKGRINTPELTAETLAKAIAEMESIAQERDKPIIYAGLLFAGDSTRQEYGAFLQKMRERSTAIGLHTLFFELELMAIPQDQADRLLADPAMARYAHYVSALRLAREHVLSEPEERILEEKANTGDRAFVRLFDETISHIGFEITLDGETKTLTEPEVLNLLRHPDRETRRAAAESLTKGLLGQGRLLTFIFNDLLQDKAVEDRLRGYSDPAESRHIANELDADIVAAVIETARRNYGVVERYYNIKKRILGLDTLTHYDRYAPLFQTKEKVAYAEARDIILDAFGAFSPTMARVADEFFQNGWIDAEPRKGKRGGAFCSYVTADLHPYVFQSYLDQMDDVMTLGHELGHGIHAYLSRPLGYLNMHGTLPMAELASTFGEMLVFEKLQETASLPDRMALYANKLEGVFATVFRQAAMYQFERDIHTARREQGELTTAQIGAFWQNRQQEMFGNSVELGDEHANWWMYISHFLHVPFYVYAYTIGELLVLSLYAKSKKEGKETFEPKYLDLLRAGGSLSPRQLMAKMDIDLGDPGFWQGGCDVLTGLLDRFEQLYSEWESAGRPV